MQPIDRPSKETDKKAGEYIGYIRGGSLIQTRVLVSPKSKSTDTTGYSFGPDGAGALMKNKCYFEGED